ncbi:MAG: carboxypeptidase regulatory-like domain-containing protein [Thermoanaerobaculia bacterium]
MKRLLLAAGCLAGLACLAGCNDSPTEPDRRLAPRLSLFCLTPDVRVTCGATLYNVPTSGAARDVTYEATWLVSSSAATLSSPGIITPTGHGEVEVRAVFQQWETEPFTFLVDPAQTSRWIYFLSGTVRDEETGKELHGAMVEILSGYSKGTETATNENGYYLFPKILTGEAFTARAWRAGYAISTATYRVDPPQGLGTGNPPFLEFRLRKTGP